MRADVSSTTPATDRGAARKRLAPPLSAAALWVLPASAVVLLYGRAMGLWWTWDELIYLRVVARHAPWEYLFVPAVYRELTPAFFFPGVLLSFEADFSLGGTAPWLYFAHQLAALVLAVGLLTHLLRRWVPTAAAVTASLLFLAGPPLSTVVAELMTRHYLEGLAVSLGATLLFVRSVDRRSPRLAVAAALAGFVASSCKEVFVPLPLVLAVLPVGRLRDRLRALVPFVPAVAAYAAWRQVMLAGYVGAYADDATRIEASARRAALLGHQFLSTALGGPGGAVLALAGAVGALALLPVLLRPGSRLLAAGLVVAVGAPMIPVAERLDPRFGFLSWLLVALLVGTSSASWWERGRAGRAVAAFLVAGAFAVALPANRGSWKALERRAWRVRTEGEFVLSGNGGEALLRPFADREFFRNLAWMRRDLLGRSDPAPKVVWDEVYFCENPSPALRVHEYSEARRGVVRLEGTGADACARLRSRSRDEPSMSFRLEYGEGALRWELEPAGPGRWSLVEGADAFVFPVPAKGGIGFVIPRRLVVRARLERPDGTVAYSPPLGLEIHDGVGSVSWDGAGRDRTFP